MSYCPAKHSGFLTGISASPCRSLPIQQLEGWEIIIWILSSKGFQFQRTKSKLPSVASHALRSDPCNLLLTHLLQPSGHSSERPTRSCPRPFARVTP